MKKLILFVLLLGAAIFAGRLVYDVIADAQGAPASGNGDVNGDGARDISDAVYLLSWLFSGGPAPVALAGSPELESRVAGLEEAVAALQGSAGGVAAAVESLALLLGDPAIADGVPTGALQPLDRASPFALYLGGEPFGQVIGVHIVEEVSSVPVAHVAVRIASSVMETDPLLGALARLDFQQQDRLTHFAGEVIAAGHAGRQGRGGIVRLSIAPRLHRLTRSRRSRTFEVTKYSDVVAAVLGGHEVPYTGIASGIQREHVFQYNETDFDFVSRLMEEEGIHYFFDHGPEGETLRMSANSMAAPAVSGVFSYRGHQGGALTPGEAYIHTFHAAVRNAPGTVQVTGWDYVQKQRITRAQATGVEGALQDDFLGQRDSLEEVDIEARLRRDRALVEARSVRGTSTISSLRPGSAVTIDGVGGAFDGKYFVTGVRHTFVTSSAGGQTTSLYGNAFQCIPASVPFRPERRTPRPVIEGTQTAIVTDNKDPDDLGRVRVKFPWLNNGMIEAQSSWIRLSLLGAGKDRGWYCLPEVDDEVLVAFTHGDPHHPVVLGGLWNGKDAPPETPTDKNDIRSFRSRSGHRLVFDDTDGREKIAIQAVKPEPPGEPSAIALEAEATQVSGMLQSSSDATPGAAIHPGERHRDNSIVAWARVSAAGAVAAPASFGVAQVQRVRTGAYSIALSGAAKSAAELIPLAVAEVSGPPGTPAEMRIVSVEQVNATSFFVYINNGLAQSADASFVFLVTAR